MVSVIIPLYNRSQLIPFTLSSLSAENHAGIKLEIIVVDDGSTDGGPELVKNQFPWVRLVRNQANKGAPACRNQGLALASFEYLLFLDSDDLIDLDFFKERLKAIVDHKHIGGVYGPYEYFESEGTNSSIHKRPRKSNFPLYPYDERSLIIRNMLQGWYIPPHSILWKKKVLLEINGYNEKLLINQDVDICLRVLLRYPIIGVKAPLAWKRMHHGEKIGLVNSDIKLRQLLELRINYLAELERLDQLNQEIKDAVAKFLFNKWVEFRKVYPTTSMEFLVTSKKLSPNLRLSGSIGLRLIARLLGNDSAIILKQSFRRRALCFFT
jgi:glycosyltransferase involved in cell wall biosynthesis